jgi:hypothetical protein
MAYHIISFFVIPEIVSVLDTPCLERTQITLYSGPLYCFAYDNLSLDGKYHYELLQTSSASL